MLNCSMLYMCAGNPSSEQRGRPHPQAPDNAEMRIYKVFVAAEHKSRSSCKHASAEGTLYVHVDSTWRI